MNSEPLEFITWRAENPPSKHKTQLVILLLNKKTKKEMLELGSLTVTHRHNGALSKITKWAYSILISKTMNLNIQTNKQLECRF